MTRFIPHIRVMVPIIIVVCTIAISGEQKRLVIDNPYHGIVWSSNESATAWQRHKANFHTHTTQSDGSFSPSDAIDRYYQKGYAVLALTDHNKLTWPWSTYGRDPDALGMVAIPGNEFSSGHHRGSFFAEIDGDPGSDVAQTFTRIQEGNGVAMLYHPGRYTNAVSWYVDIYKRFPLCFGLEVFNQGDRYRGDRDKWDSLLVELMPQRPVWGYSNDDMHTAGHLYRNYNIIFVPTLTTNNVRIAMERGRSYFSYEPGGSGEAKAPGIDSIVVDTLTMSITISAKNFTQIEWIAGGTRIDTGANFACNQHFSENGPVARYVRARISGQDGETHTQPFGVRFVDSGIDSNSVHTSHSLHSAVIKRPGGLAIYTPSTFDILGRRLQRDAVVFAGVSGRAVQFVQTGGRGSGIVKMLVVR